MYNLIKQVPYEGDCTVCSGSLEEIKEWLRTKKSSMDYIDDFYLTMDPDVCLYDLYAEAKADATT